MGAFEQIKEFTGKKIQYFLSQSAESQVRASLARLRRGIGHAPGEIPELWGEYLLGMPDDLLGHGNEISRAEWAVYTALTMFALHQQGKSLDSEQMHKSGVSIGTAANRLIKNENEDRERVGRRFYPFALSADMTELSYHLRGLISLLRSESIPLDYALLAADLYLFQDTERKEQVKLRWGEDFCRINNSTNNDNE